MEEAREFAALDMEGKSTGALEVTLHEGRPEITNHVIETIRRMEVNTSLYAAGSFAPMLVLLNLTPFFYEHVEYIEKQLAVAAICILGFSGIIFVIYRALYINFKRTQVEVFRAGVVYERFDVDSTEEFTLTVFESLKWKIAIRFAFLAMLIGWIIMALLVVKVLLGS
ncbi:MAG: hypothetical protein ACPGVT_11335 [Maricaulaceae bacterium]